MPGQIKAPGERHEKDDRYRLDDRSRYVLGWHNAAKIAALETKAKHLEKSLGELGSRLSRIQTEQTLLKERLTVLSKLGEYADYHELDWQLLAVELAGLHDEKQKLESASDILKQLTKQLNEAIQASRDIEIRLETLKDKRSKIEQKKIDSEALLVQIQALLNDTAGQSGLNYLDF
ncbi:MAG: hypothetical protein RQ714_07950 [Nitrosomonas sp.]|nr:hypothetical protein [Nitrosomonas sp.]